MHEHRERDEGDGPDFDVAQPVSANDKARDRSDRRAHRPQDEQMPEETVERRRGACRHLRHVAGDRVHHPEPAHRREPHGDRRDERVASIHRRPHDSGKRRREHEPAQDGEDAHRHEEERAARRGMPRSGGRWGHGVFMLQGCRSWWRRAGDSNSHVPCGTVDFKSTALPVEASPPCLRRRSFTIHRRLTGTVPNRWPTFRWEGSRCDGGRSGETHWTG